MTMTITRRLQFCCGHRVAGHESKCAHLHGHNYVVYLTAEHKYGHLDSIGRVIDFSVLKDKYKTWIDDNWDHGFVLWVKDDSGIQAMHYFSEDARSSENKVDFQQKLFLLRDNPTAENMAAFLLELGNDLLDGTDVRMKKVELWETENCYAVVER